MKRVLTAAIFAAGLGAFGAQAGTEAPRLPVSLTSFGAAQALSSYKMSAAGLVLGPSQTYSQNIFAAAPVMTAISYGGYVPPPSFAASSALSPSLALDSGYNLDLTTRFGDYDTRRSPLIDQASFLGLANGGHYAGVTYVPTPSLRLRLGAQTRSERLDSFTFDPTAGLGGLAFASVMGQTHSLLAGFSWDVTRWAGFNLDTISSTRNDQPAFGPLASLTRQTRSTTNAFDVSAHMNLGGDWVTTASFGQGLAQLDQKSSPSVAARSYSIAIAKNGLFGEDALGFSFSRPSTPSSGFEMVSTSGDLPPVFIANNRLTDRAPETDLQLGYVTSFLDGALALQTNAAYQMNYQGQTGATSLAVLSRAKIKF